MQTELGYVMERLGQMDRASIAVVAKKTKIHFRTITRLLYRESQAPKYKTISKLATHFRTEEQRQQ